ncbi:uncharacterized protein [Nicotiana tomentosiformis]|uniref:uncharacterized protein n=1 Tax=Nicotiana tomentosiformis TaxID=4098 RepID=UPI00388CC30F
MHLCHVFLIFPPSSPTPSPSYVTHSPIPTSSSSSSEPILDNLFIKSSRPHNPPAYLKDYICNIIQLTDVSGSCFLSLVTPSSFSFNDLSTSNQHLLNSFFTIQEPTSYTQATHHPGWQEAMEREIEALELNHTWEVMELPPVRKALPCK